MGVKHRVSPSSPLPLLPLRLMRELTRHAPLVLVELKEQKVFNFTIPQNEIPSPCLWDALLRARETHRWILKSFWILVIFSHRQPRPRS